MRQQHIDSSFPCICLRRALDTSAIIKCNFKKFELWNQRQWYHTLKSSEICTLVVTVDLEQEATSKGDARVASAWRSVSAESESTLRDAQAESGSVTIIRVAGCCPGRWSRTDSDCASRSRDSDYAAWIYACCSQTNSDCACRSQTDSECACRSRTDLDHDCARQWAATVEPVCPAGLWGGSGAVEAWPIMVWGGGAAAADKRSGWRWYHANTSYLTKTYYDFTESLYPKNHDFTESLYHVFAYIPRDIMGFGRYQGYQGPWSCMIS